MSAFHITLEKSLEGGGPGGLAGRHVNLRPISLVEENPTGTDNVYRTEETLDSISDSYTFISLIRNQLKLSLA